MSEYKSRYTGSQIDAAIANVDRLAETIESLQKTILSKDDIIDIVTDILADDTPDSPIVLSHDYLTLNVLSTNPNVPSKGSYILFARQDQNEVNLYGMDHKGQITNITQNIIDSTCINGKLSLQLTKLDNGVLELNNTKNIAYTNMFDVVDVSVKNNALYITDEPEAIDQDDIIDNIAIKTE